MTLLTQSFTILLMFKGDEKALKRELFYTLTLTKGKSTLSLTSSLFSIIELTLHSFHPTLSGGRVQLKVLKGEDTQGCSQNSAYEMINFEMQEVRNDKDRH
jgi:hypothetical protein